MCAPPTEAYRTTGAVPRAVSYLAILAGSCCCQRHNSKGDLRNPISSPNATIWAAQVRHPLSILAPFLLFTAINGPETSKNNLWKRVSRDLFLLCIRRSPWKQARVCLCRQACVRGQGSNFLCLLPVTFGALHSGNVLADFIQKRIPALQNKHIERGAKHGYTWGLFSSKSKVRTNPEPEAPPTWFNVRQSHGTIHLAQSLFPASLYGA